MYILYNIDIYIYICIYVYIYICLFCFVSVGQQRTKGKEPQDAEELGNSSWLLIPLSLMVPKGAGRYIFIYIYLKASPLPPAPLDAGRLLDCWTGFSVSSILTFQCIRNSSWDDFSILWGVSLGTWRLLSGVRDELFGHPEVTGTLPGTPWGSKAGFY